MQTQGGSIYGLVLSSRLVKMPQRPRDKGAQEEQFLFPPGQPGGGPSSNRSPQVRLSSSLRARCALRGCSPPRSPQPPCTPQASPPHGSSASYRKEKNPGRWLPLEEDGARFLHLTSIHSPSPRSHGQPGCEAAGPRRASTGFAGRKEARRGPREPGAASEQWLLVPLSGAQP